MPNTTTAMERTLRLSLFQRGWEAAMAHVACRGPALHEPCPEDFKAGWDTAVAAYTQAMALYQAKLDGRAL